MALIEKKTIQRVHDTASITEIASKYVNLRRAGHNLTGCCPFHQERNPSFFVFPERNNYKCFSCGAHGDAIEFVKQIENKTYPEAIESIAEMYGIPVFHNERQLPDEDLKKKELREAMRAGVSKVQEFFTACFNADNEDARKAREYAYSRWGDKYCQELGVGWAPDSFSALPDFVRNSGLDERTMTEASILGEGKNGTKYGFFRGRVTIPIRDRIGRIIAFTARYIGDDPTQPKYINSKNTEIFEKGNTVFGLHTAARKAKRTGKYVIVEGAPDVISLQSDFIGITEAVAGLGTSWTEKQFKQLSEISSICFIPDADVPKEGEYYGAGVRAVMKNGLTAVKEGFSVSVRELPLEKKEIRVPLFDFEIEELIERGVKKYERTKVIGERLYKNDADSYIKSREIYASLDEVPFAEWYGLKVLRSRESETERAEAVTQICEDVLVFVKDEVLLDLTIKKLSREFGSVKIWRDTLQKKKRQLRDEKRRKESSSLPDDLYQLRELGITVKNGCYCSYDKEGDLYRWSNFLLTPMYHIVDGDNAIRIFRIKNTNGVEKELQLRQEDLISLARFQQKVEVLGNFVFKGKIDDLQNLKEYLYDHTKTAVQITKLGWNRKEGIYAFGDGIYKNNRLYLGNNLGLVEIDDSLYFLPAVSSLNEEMQDDYQFERSFTCTKHGDAGLYDYVQKMVEVFGDNAKVGFAFVLSTIFLDVIKEGAGNMPLLNVFGPKGSGKTELGVALSSFFTPPAEPPSLASTTVASMNDMLSCAENNIVHLDEYKNALHFKKIEILKAIWGGAGQSKKNMDGKNKKVKRTFVKSAVVLTGQDAPSQDDALFSRVLNLSYTNTVFSAEQEKRYQEFKNMSAKGASHLTVQILRLRSVFEADYAKQYDICKGQLRAALGDEQIETRVLKNWTAVLASFLTAQTSLELPFDYKNLFEVCLNGIKEQNERCRKISDVAVFWKLLDSSHMTGKVVEKAHYTIKYQERFKLNNGSYIEFENNKPILYLNYQNVVTSLGTVVNGVSMIGKLDPMSMESYLKASPAFIGTKQFRFRILQVNGTPDFEFEGQIKKYKEIRPMSMVFDYNILKEMYEINLETSGGTEESQGEEEEELKSQPKFADSELFKETNLYNTDDDPF